MKQSPIFVLSPLIVLTILVFQIGTALAACDLCAVPRPIEGEEMVVGDFALGLAEQFTSYRTLKLNGDEVANSIGERLQSSSTQLYLRYQITDRVGLQLTAPYVYRDFERAGSGGIKESGSETGFGDLSMLLRYVPVKFRSGAVELSWRLRFGIELPTGDSDRLGEERHEDTSDEEDKDMGHDDHHDHGVQSLATGHLEHNQVTGIHGHDLALGSGSLDWIVGTEMILDLERSLVSVGGQYTIRSEGDFGYRYHNDLIWAAAVGRRLELTDDKTLLIKLAVGGEYKGMDVLAGDKVADTGMNSIYVGPEVSLVHASSWSGGFALDFPLLQDNTGLQLVSDYRVRAQVAVRY